MSDEAYKEFGGNQLALHIPKKREYSKQERLQLYLDNIHKTNVEKIENMSRKYLQDFTKILLQNRLSPQQGLLRDKEHGLQACQIHSF